jgi:hypothetical protein
LWSFTEKQESFKLKPRLGNCDVETDSNSEDESNLARIIHKYSIKNPQHGTKGHRERMDAGWPKYLVKRLPDHKSLEDSRDLLPKEKQGRREDYAKGVLTMSIVETTIEKKFIWLLLEKRGEALTNTTEKDGMPTN